MMLIWVIFAALLGAASLMALLPLSRGGMRSVMNADARLMYEAQLADIAQDLNRGVISAADAELARAEVARRLIRAAKDGDVAADAVGEATYRRRRAASAIILSTIPLVALSLYAAKGSPLLPAKPLAARLSTDPANMDLAVALTRVENHLQLNPSDGRGWEVLAPIYLRTGRFDDAARAYANVAIHLGPTMERLVDVGEARVLAASGVVTADARAAFDEARKLAPLNPKGLYYLAIARDQDGDKAGAVADLKVLLASAPADAGWKPMVEERIAAIEGAPQGGEAIAALAPHERMAAIRGMVEGLSIRLAERGGTPEEWGRLVRARAVMGERKLAEDVLARARAALASDAAGLASVEGVARESGLDMRP
jgi:cytochrome c-type biogenesis protein CcmH